MTGQKNLKPRQRPTKAFTSIKHSNKIVLCFSKRQNCSPGEFSVLERRRENRPQITKEKCLSQRITCGRGGDGDVKHIANIKAAATAPKEHLWMICSYSKSSSAVFLCANMRNCCAWILNPKQLRLVQLVQLSLAAKMENTFLHFYAQLMLQTCSSESLRGVVVPVSRSHVSLLKMYVHICMREEKRSARCSSCSCRSFPPRAGESGRLNWLSVQKSVAGESWEWMWDSN